MRTQPMGKMCNFVALKLSISRQYLLMSYCEAVVAGLIPGPIETGYHFPQLQWS